MKTIVDDRTKLNSLELNYEDAKMLMHILHDPPDAERPNFAGQWSLDTNKKTVLLDNLTIIQACALDVLMADRLRAVNDMVDCLDFVLEQAIESPPST